jgi:hypothetical protein
MVTSDGRLACLFGCGTICSNAEALVLHMGQCHQAPNLRQSSLPVYQQPPPPPPNNQHKRITLHGYNTCSYRNLGLELKAMCTLTDGELFVLTDEGPGRRVKVPIGFFEAKTTSALKGRTKNAADVRQYQHLWVSTTYGTRHTPKADAIINLLNKIMAQLREVINTEVKTSVWTDVQEWRRVNKIPTGFFKLGHPTFANFEDVSLEYKANSSPVFHNAVAQAARNVKHPAWVSALEQGLLDLIGFQYSCDQLTRQPQKNRRQGCIRDLISIQRGTVLRPFEKVLCREARGGRKFYQDVTISLASSSSSSSHPQHQPQYGYPLAAYPTHQHPTAIWRHNKVIQQDWAPLRPLVGLSASTPSQPAASMVAHLPDSYLPPSSSDSSDDSSDDSSKQESPSQFGNYSRRYSESFAQGNLAAGTVSSFRHSN